MKLEGGSDDMQVNATSELLGGGFGILAILALSMIVGWAKHWEDRGPQSVTIVGISEPGFGAGLYNGLRAKSIPTATEISEQRLPGARIYSLAQTGIIQ